MEVKCLIKKTMRGVKKAFWKPKEGSEGHLNKAVEVKIPSVQQPERS